MCKRTTKEFDQRECSLSFNLRFRNAPVRSLQATCRLAARALSWLSVTLARAGQNCRGRGWDIGRTFSERPPGKDNRSVDVDKPVRNGSRSIERRAAGGSSPGNSSAFTRQHLHQVSGEDGVVFPSRRCVSLSRSEKPRERPVERGNAGTTFLTCRGWDSHTSCARGAPTVCEQFAIVAENVCAF